MNYVFGYGSLVEYLNESPPIEARLTGYKRLWNVAMDNSVDVPGYRFFTNRLDGKRPDVCVTFLNIKRAMQSEINGILVASNAKLLATLDRRERNYVRVDVTELLQPTIPNSKVYAYVGKDEAVERFNNAKNSGKAVVSEDYMQKVLEGFSSLGNEQLRLFHWSTAPAKLPILKLDEIKL